MNTQALTATTNTVTPPAQTEELSTLHKLALLRALSDVFSFDYAEKAFEMLNVYRANFSDPNGFVQPELFVAKDEYEDHPWAELLLVVELRFAEHLNSLYEADSQLKNMSITRKMALYRSIGDFTGYEDSLDMDELLLVYLSSGDDEYPVQIWAWEPFEHYDWSDLSSLIDEHAVVVESDIKSLMGYIHAGITHETIECNLDSDVGQWDMQHILSVGMSLVE